jgi:hypothetical protein
MGSSAKTLRSAMAEYGLPETVKSSARTAVMVTATASSKVHFTKKFIGQKRVELGEHPSVTKVADF